MNKPGVFLSFFLELFAAVTHMRFNVQRPFRPFEFTIRSDAMSCNIIQLIIDYI